MRLMYYASMWCILVGNGLHGGWSDTWSDTLNKHLNRLTNAPLTCNEKQCKRVLTEQESKRALDDLLPPRYIGNDVTPGQEHAMATTYNRLNACKQGGCTQEEVTTLLYNNAEQCLYLASDTETRRACNIQKIVAQYAIEDLKNNKQPRLFHDR